MGIRLQTQTWRAVTPSRRIPIKPILLLISGRLYVNLKILDVVVRYLPHGLVIIAVRFNKIGVLLVKASKIVPHLHIAWVNLKGRVVQTVLGLPASDTNKVDGVKRGFRQWRVGLRLLFLPLAAATSITTKESYRHLIPTTLHPTRLSAEGATPATRDRPSETEKFSML